MVDPGAYDNLGGDEFYYRVGNKAMQALGKSKMEHVLSIKPLSKELGIQGVGQGQQRVTESASVITGMTEDKELSSFSSPIARNSQLPGLLGLKTLKRLNSVVDCRPGCSALYTAENPEDIEINIKNTGKKRKLVTAPSGHLLLPCTDYKDKSVSKASPHYQSAIQ